MTRRTAVLAVGAALLVVFGVLGVAVPVPYVAQVPGPTVDTLGEVEGEPVITVAGRERDEVAGTLTLTTVGVGDPGLTLVEAVHGWFDGDVSVVPEEAVYPPDRTEEEVREVNRQAFLTSEEMAEAAALRHLGYPVKVVVRGLAEDSPSEGRLEEGDALESVDGRPTPDAGTLDQVLRSIPGGTTVPVGYTRQGRPGTATVTTRAAEDREGALLGVLVREQPSPPFDVDIGRVAVRRGAELTDVGGPSAGLMLALGILELVEDDDLTGGAAVAGTGTIDELGTVGRVGGVPLKMAAAARIGAELFLVPADNCPDALTAPQPGLTLARVATLEDAVEALAAHREGRTPAPC